MSAAHTVPCRGSSRRNRQKPGYQKLLSILFLLAAVVLPLRHSLAFTDNEFLPISLIATLGGKTGESRLRQPSAVLTSRDGKVFVLDGAVNRVAVFSPRGKFLYDFGANHLNMPLGMTMDSKERIYIADTRKGRIQLFTSRGKHLEQIDLPKSSKGIPTEPVDLAVDDRRKLLYIVDNRNHRVLIYDLQKKTVIKTVGKMGMEDGELRWPFSLVLDEKGVVYLVDVINTTIRTIHPDHDWAFEYNIGSWGIQKGEFFRPKGIAIDSGGNLLVSDSYLGVIQMFDRSGRFMAVLSDADKKIHRFTTPARLFVDRENRLYVVEMFANRISVFRMGR